MMNCIDEERFPSRKNPRLKNFDYTTPNYYFVTICTRKREMLFGEPGELNAFGKIAETGIREIAQHFPNAKVDKYVVMPNHIHAIIVLDGTGASLPVIIGQYKAHVTAQIRKLASEKHVWQTSFHDHVIRNQKAYETIWLYVDSNPQNWQKDCFFTECENYSPAGGVMTPPYSTGTE